MSEHLLNASEVGPAFEQMSGERVPQEMGVDALGLEAGLGREAAEDQERAGARERTALRVEEELRPVPPVEVRPAAGEVATQRLDGLPTHGDNALLAAFAQRSHEPLVEVDAGFVESDRLAHAQTGAVEKLDKSPIA